MIGIYAIINKLNNDMYIGSAKNIHKRIYNHFIKLKHRNHPNSFLQRAKNKYGNVRWRNLGYKKRIGRLISKVASKRYLNLKYRKKLSEAQKLMWKNPKYRINRQKTQNKANKKRSASMKVAWRNPIIRERIVKSLRRKRV